MAIPNRMFARPVSRSVEQNAQPILWIDAREIRTMRTQFSKQWIVVRSDSLSDDGDAQPWNRRRLRGNSLPQTITIVIRGFAECVELMRAPQMCGKLFYELRGRLDPIKSFQLRGKFDFVEFVKPLFALIVGERTDFSQLPFMGSPLGGKLEIEINEFAEQARLETQRQRLQRSDG
jgi:hypothetical protein